MCIEQAAVGTYGAVRVDGWKERARVVDFVPFEVGSERLDARIYGVHGRHDTKDVRRVGFQIRLSFEYLRIVHNHPPAYIPGLAVSDPRQIALLVEYVLFERLQAPVYGLAEIGQVIRRMRRFQGAVYGWICLRIVYMACAVTEIAVDIERSVSFGRRCDRIGKIGHIIDSAGTLRVNPYFVERTLGLGLRLRKRELEYARQIGCLPGVRIGVDIHEPVPDNDILRLVYDLVLDIVSGGHLPGLRIIHADA